MAGFLGMRGTGDWVTDQMPESWRETILYLYPNGMAPLTAIMSKMGSNKIDSPIHHWWTMGLPAQEATVTGVYNNALLSSAYVSGAVAGSILYVKCAEADTNEFRVGHQVMMNSSTYPTLMGAGEIVGIVKNGASSYISVRMHEADDNGPAGKYLITAYVNSLLIIGNINAQGGPRPPAIAYDPTGYSNRTQIWRNALSMTNTAIETHLRTGDDYIKAKKECLELHSIEMEKSLIWSVGSVGVGDNGKPKYTMQGIIPFIRQYAPTYIFDYQTDADYHGKTWLEGGEDWLDKVFEQIYRYGDPERLMLTGSGAMRGVQQLVKSVGTFNFVPTTASYGIKVTDWTTPFGVTHMKTHPLFSFRAASRNMGLVLSPKNLLWCPLGKRDTFFIPKGKTESVAGETGIDGTEEEYLTEATLEYHHPTTFAVMYGIGLDHTA